MSDSDLGSSKVAGQWRYVRPVPVSPGATRIADIDFVVGNGVDHRIWCRPVPGYINLSHAFAFATTEREPVNIL